ncbi:unnamed protein product [Oikopleura dioica]|uniref:Uncharacterized protein n=1 Tax=Oikopleura dioica TaxID=34765 RepID=E4XPV6_OIKDI|nr:unnamed protein product [Oikopleura dioica]
MKGNFVPALSNRPGDRGRSRISRVFKFRILF